MTAREELAAHLHEHRPNYVTEKVGLLIYPSGWRTRVKCEGNRCDFYAEDESWYSALAKHDEHAADALLASPALARVMGEAKAEAWDEGFTRGFYDVLAGGARDTSESKADNPYRDQAEEPT